ncbi:MAG TPA: DinB family protein [Ktedonosporobacter sp.]|nr:DinB family protein [Ktedonosporobacter sp.]
MTEQTLEQTLPLITFYKGWETYQQMLVEMIASLTPEQLALPASSHKWTTGMLAQHIIANRVWWFQVWMGEGSPSLAPIAHWDPQDVEWQPVHDAATLVAGLESTWKMVADSLGRWTATDLETIFQPPAAEHSPPFSRRWIIWHVLEHEIHHGGELSVALGAHGLPGIYGNM